MNFLSAASAGVIFSEIFYDAAGGGFSRGAGAGDGGAGWDDAAGASGLTPGGAKIIGRIYPVLNTHEIGTSEDRELVVRWQSEIEGAAKELDRILEEQKRRDAQGPHCEACGSPVREEVPSLGMPQ